MMDEKKVYPYGYQEVDDILLSRLVDEHGNVVSPTVDRLIETVRSLREDVYLISEGRTDVIVKPRKLETVLAPAPAPSEGEVWLRVFESALTVYREAGVAVNAADLALKAYAERFMEPAEDDEDGRCEECGSPLRLEKVKTERDEEQKVSKMSIRFPAPDADGYFWMFLESNGVANGFNLGKYEAGGIIHGMLMDFVAREEVTA